MTERMELTLRDTVARALADPGQIVPRIMDFIPPRWEGDSPDVEPLHLWQTRATLAALGLDRPCWNCHGRVRSCGSCYGWSLSCSCPRDKQGDRRGHHVESCGYSKSALTATPTSENTDG